MSLMTKAQPATKKELEENVKRLGKAIEANRKAIEANRKAIEANRKAIKSLEKRSLAFEWKIEGKIDGYQQEVKKMITDFRDEILRHLNGTVKELETTREEQEIVGHQLTEHGEKIEDHEKRIVHLETA